MDSNTKFIFLVIILSFLVLFSFKTLELYTDIKKNKVLLFYTKWCKNSNDFLKHWEKTKLGFNNIDFIEYDLDENPDIAEEYKISYVPTVYMIKDNEKIKFIGEPNQGSLGSFIILNLQDNI